jgi:predicted nucleic acid-binding protein
VRIAVLDTNVMVSAGMRSETAPARLVLEWILEGRVQLVTSPRIVAEYGAVLARPKFQRFGFPPLWLEFLIEESLRLPDAERWPHAGPDPGDLPFLALAHTAGAWLVTGNLRHFSHATRQGVTVISPSDYLAHLLQSSLAP